MDDKLTAKTAKFTSLENLYVYGILKLKKCLLCNTCHQYVNVHGMLLTKCIMNCCQIKLRYQYTSYISRLCFMLMRLLKVDIVAGWYLIIKVWTKIKQS